MQGTVFQTAVFVCIIYPETSSRVTLASLGIVFQTILVVLLFCCFVVLLSGCFVVAKALFAFNKTTKPPDNQTTNRTFKS